MHYCADGRTCFNTQENEKYVFVSYNIVDIKTCYNKERKMHETHSVEIYANYYFQRMKDG